MNTEQRIEQKVTELIPTLEELPGIVIIHHIFNFNVIYMSRRGLEYLDITMEELRAMGADYHRRFFNQDEAKEYVPKLSAMLDRNNSNDMVSFFQQVRQAEHKDWQWFLSSIKILLWDDDGRPLLTITIATPIDPQHHITSKVERLLEENNFLRKYKHIYASLTPREKEVLKLTAQDKASNEIAEQLYLSEETIKTHRKRIKKKINAENQYDIVRFAQAFDII